MEEAPLVVVKRSGGREPFDAAKVVRGVSAAATGRPISEAQIVELGVALEERFRLQGTEVSSDDVGRAVLDWLRGLDEVASVRFASVYKDFTGLDDFEREVDLLSRSRDPL